MAGDTLCRLGDRDGEHSREVLRLAGRHLETLAEEVRLRSERTTHRTDVSEHVDGGTSLLVR
jgi:hypothetical protein